MSAKAGSVPRGREGTANRDRVGLWLAALVALITVIFQGGDIGWSDGMSMYQVARSVVVDGDVAIELGVVWEGVDGRYYSPFGLGLSVMAIPLYSVVALVRLVVPIPEFAAQGFVSLLMPLIAAALSSAVYALATRLGGSRTTSLLAALGVIFGTYLLVYTKTFASEPLAALLLVIAIERALARSPILSGAGAAGAALARPQLFAFAPLLLLVIWHRQGVPAAARASIPLVGAIGLQLAYDMVRWGDPFNIGYSGTEVSQGFTTPILEGLGGLLFHPQKSLFLFAPVIVLLPPALARLWRSERSAFWLVGGVLAITLAFSATWWDWGGGFTWGPRLLLPAIPAAIATIPGWVGELRGRRWAFVALLVVGGLVSLPSLVVGGGAQLADDPPPDLGPAILRTYSLLPDTASSTLHEMYLDEDGRDETRVLYLWQVGLAWRTGPTGLAVAIVATAALAALAVWCAVRLVSEVRLPRDPQEAVTPSGRTTHRR